MMLESPPSTPGMCGYLLKFPSEGSNHPVHSTAVGDGSYPAKCPTCQVAWASSASDMRKHRSECTDTTKEQDGLTEADPWGVPRQFWIEIDFERELLQWRETYDSKQQESFQLQLSSILRIEPYDQEGFSLQTSDRTMRFTATSEDERNVWLHEMERLVFVMGKPPIVHDAEQVVEAMARNDHAFLDGLLRNDASLIYTVDQHNNTLLMLACTIGATRDMLSTLMDWGVDCNQQNNAGEFPLIYLAAADEEDLVQLLLERGHNIEINQCTPKGVTALHAAAVSGSVRVLTQLLEAGCDPYAIDFKGGSPLHYAAEIVNGADAIHVLCDAAGDMIDCINTDSETALHVAAINGHLQVIRALVETAAATTLTEQYGNTAFALAQINGHEECADLLNQYDTVILPSSPEVHVQSTAAEINPRSSQYTTPSKDHYDSANVPPPPFAICPFVVDSRIEQHPSSIYRTAQDRLMCPISPMNATPGHATKYVIARQQERRKRRAMQSSFNKR